jgi:SAM-dependent methyltransferase
MAEFQGHTSEFWDERYRDEAFVYGEAPSGYLAAQRGRFRPGMRALVPGDGEGRNGVWLAEQGLDVVTVDLSAAGVEKAKRLAAKRGVRIDAIQADLATWAWPTEAFDVVAAIFLHLPPDLRRLVHRNMLAALRPGGLLVIEAYRPEQVQYRQTHGSRGGPPAAEMMFSEAMLREDFAGAEVIELESGEVDLKEGANHFGLGAVVHGVFRRREDVGEQASFGDGANSIVALIAMLKERPGFYDKSPTIESLSAFLSGWMLAHNDRWPDDGVWTGFDEFVRRRFKFDETVAWDSAIRFHAPNSCEAYGLFFELFDEYLNSRR